MDMMVDDASASQISDKMKDILSAKSAERVDGYRSTAANALFGSDEVQADEVEDGVSDEEQPAEIEDNVNDEDETVASADDEI